MNKRVMTLSEIIPPSQILNQKLDLNSQIQTLTDDSRKANSGSLFFAIRGHSSDGHSFLPKVIEQGAEAVVIDRSELFESTDRSILVKNTRETIGLVAAKWFGEPTQKLKLVGVTGTNGKTTSTFILENVLESLGKKTGLIGTVCNKIGKKILGSELTTPGPIELQELFKQMLDSSISHAVMEVSSIALDQYRTNGTHFAAGLFTNLSGDHLDYHGSMENYFHSKLRLFRDYKIPVGIFWKDDAYTLRLIKESNIKNFLTFSLHKGTADFSVLEAALSSTHTWARVKTPSQTLEFQTPLIGTYNLLNCLGVIATLSALGEDENAVAQALSTSHGAPGRLERVMAVGKYPNVFVDYAHSDDALLNVLRALNELKGKGTGRIITVFGCGGDRDKSKRPRMAKVASCLSDVTIVTSDNPRTEDPDTIMNEIESGIEKSETEFYRLVDRKQAIELALSIAKTEDCVLIAGKGHETYQIIGTTKYPFDDREVVRRYYA